MYLAEHPGVRPKCLTLPNVGAKGTLAAGGRVPPFSSGAILPPVNPAPTFLPPEMRFHANLSLRKLSRVFTLSPFSPVSRRVSGYNHIQARVPDPAVTRYIDISCDRLRPLRKNEVIKVIANHKFAQFYDDC